MNPALYSLGNRLFDRCYFLYKPVYGAYKAFSDRHERAELRKLLRPGMTVLDIGANIGVYSKFLSRLVGQRGHVHAFEPSPENFRRLKETVESLGNVVPVWAAISDTAGRIPLYISDSLNVDHRTYDSGEGRRRVDVPAIRLDDHFAPGRRVDCIKIDVQGYEYRALCGARRILEENQEIVIMMEFWPYGLTTEGTSPEVLLAFLEGIGFSLRPMGGRGRHPIDIHLMRSDHVHDYCNLLVARQHRNDHRPETRHI